MKVVFPKHIKKWIFASMSFQMWPINLNIIQIFILAVWIAAGFGMFNAVAKSAGKWAGAVIAIPIVIIFIVIAFFQVSEMWLLAFVWKFIRNNFLDVNRKFQTDFERFDPIELEIKRAHTNLNPEQVMEQKEKKMTKKTLDEIQNSGLI